MRLICAGVVLFAATEGHAFFGRSSHVKQDIEAAVKQAAEISREAEQAWKDGQDAARAIALYQQAVDMCLETEEKHPKADLGAVRFRRAFCETQIDQVKFDAATGPHRRMAMMEARPDPLVKEEADGVADPVAADATPPTIPADAGEGAGPATAGQSAVPVLVRVGDELGWARDMLDADDPRESRGALMKVLQAEPDNREARLLLAVLNCRSLAFQDALLILEDLQAEGEDESVQLLIAGAFLGAGQPYRAMLELDKLLTENPTHPDALMNMAYLTMELSAKASEAEMYYRLAIKFGAVRDLAFEKRIGF